MNRRTLLGAIGGVTLASAVGTAPVLARGRGRGMRGASLVNVETVDGALVATDDDFVIANQTIDVDDIELYGGRDAIHTGGYSGVIRDTELSVSTDVASVVHGIDIGGGHVDIVDSAVTVDPGFSHQFVSVAYRAGASGTVEASAFDGGHRVGILARGAGTAVIMRRNEITGTGPTMSGWAENGIQVDQGASARIQGNLVADHWWDDSAWASTGILALSDAVSIQRNDIIGNDTGVWSTGTDSHLNGNTIVVEQDVRDFPGFDGIILEETIDNRVVNNRISGDDDAFSGILLWEAVGTKLIRNRIDGFQAEIDRFGDSETILPRPFDPAV